jgi:hypothetical protein
LSFALAKRTLAAGQNFKAGRLKPTQGILLGFDNNVGVSLITLHNHMISIESNKKIKKNPAHF